MVTSINYSDNITRAMPFMPFLPATLILTSGSMGLAKAVVHNITAHLNSDKGGLSLMPFECQNSWLLSLPLSYSKSGDYLEMVISRSKIGNKSNCFIAASIRGM
ncbi:MAG: hypothetical protein ACTS78_00270 [Arsenophonus sp. NC-WZS1-MAG3]